MELNPFLQPIGAPVTKTNSVSGYKFDSQNDRGIISTPFLGYRAVGSANIGTAAIGSANIGTAQITSALIEDAAVTNAKIVDLDASKIKAGTVTVGINLGTLGSGYLKLDGANNRITVNDGSDDRILIGYQSGGF
jgi:hypothetical protein